MRKSLCLSLMLVMPGLGHAAMAWRAAPDVVPGPAEHGERGGGHRGHGGGAPLKFYLREGEGADLSVSLPDLSSRPLTLQEDRVDFKPTGADGYHRLLARRTTGGEEQVALRYTYLPGKPTGHSPAELLRTSPARLDIVPAPLPREHWRYESGENAAFLIRFDGAPLANVPVRMITSNGTLLEETSDGAGAVRFGLPEDFAVVRKGREANAAADFVVAVEHRADATAFNTTLNAEYHVNPSHWQSTAAGGALLLAGFAAGLVMVRPREEAKA